MNAISLAGIAGAVVLGYWRLEAGLFLALFLLPFLPTPANVLIALALATLEAGRRLAGREGHPCCSPSATPVDLPLLVFGLAVATAALASLAPSSSLLALGMWVSCLAMFHLVARALKHPYQVRVIISALLLSSVAVAVIGIYQFAAGIETPSSWIDLKASPSVTTRVYSVFDNSNMLAEYLAFLLPVTAWLAAATSSWAKRAVLLGILAVQSLGLLYTFSRGGWISALVALVLLARWRERRLFPVLLAGAALAPLLLPGAALERASTLATLQDTSIKFRTSIWVAVIRLLRDYWPTGVGLGPGAFLRVYPDYLLAGTPAAHTHNLYLELVTEMGIPGLLAFLWLMRNLFLYVLPRPGDKGDSHLHGLAVALMAGIAGQLVHGLTDNTWYSSKNLVLFWIFAGLAIAARRLAALPAPEGAGPAPEGGHA